MLKLIDQLLTNLTRKYGELLVPGLLIMVLGAFFLPIPPPLLDIMLVINMTIAIVMLLLSIFISEPLSLASYPTILLIATAYRLSLNVSSTRLILLEANAGDVISSFGTFVVRGDFVVGAVIFLIITLVQFIVIAKGAERVAEVAARFTLDAMPGKQMSIDADMRAGTIDMDEAKRRRKKLERESQMYGAMDGAMKFVKGDSIIGIVITVINIAAGLFIGVARQGFEFGEALQTYSILTIGDGLVSQIPAFLIALSAGAIVTKVASEDNKSNIGQEIFTQVLADPKPLFITSFVLLLFGVIPGLPFFPFVLMSALVLGIALYTTRTHKKEAAEELVRQQEEAEEVKKEGEMPMLVPPPIVMEVSKELTHLVDGSQDEGKFINELIPLLRQGLFMELGVNFPGVQVRGMCQHLEPFAYQIKINEIPIADGRIDPGKFLVNESADNLESFNVSSIEGILPLDGSPAAWINPDQIEMVQRMGFRTWTSGEYLILHLSHILRSHGHEFLGIQEVQSMLDQLEATYPAMVKEVVPKVINLFKLTEILQRLLQEDISVRDMKNIMHALAQWAPVEQDPLVLAEYVRSSLKRYITHKYAAGNDVLSVYLLDPEIEDLIKQSIQRTDRGNFLAIEPEVTQDILKAVGHEIAQHPRTGQRPVILTTADIRRYFRRLVELEYKDLVVISYQELIPDIRIQPIARITFQ